MTSITLYYDVTNRIDSDVTNRINSDVTNRINSDVTNRIDSDVTNRIDSDVTNPSTMTSLPLYSDVTKYHRWLTLMLRGNLPSTF